ncbi:MAG: PAS domain S-box protein, partial [Verrucomicrobia bacterium]|nr:PAS domain S-box protein [Verrucomicrobiota bacterium]
MEKTVPSEKAEVILADRETAVQIPVVALDQMLQQLRSQVRLANRAAQVALWEWDLTTNEVYFSPEYRRQLGVEAAELTNELSQWESRLHPDDRERVTQGLRAFLTGLGPCYEAEYRLLQKDNSYRWMLVRAEVICDPHGRPARILGYQLDISEQREAREYQARLTAIVESSEDAIIGKTLEGIVTSWNEGARHSFGYTAEEMLGQSISRIVPLELSEEEAQILTRLRRGQRVEHYETVRRHKYGRLVNVSLTISPIQDGTGRIIGASKIARNITEQKKAEAANREAHERLQEQAAILELAPALVRDMESRIVLWTNGAERLYGFSKEEALGRVSHELFQTEFAEGKAYVDEMLCSVGRWEGELVHCKSNGERLVVASQQLVYHDPTGGPRHILEVNADITERKIAEQGLRESQARFAG